MATAALGLTPAPALADDCPNAALRAENNSTQLPECRAYEQVSPVFKEGFPPAPSAITDDGRLAYLSNGSYADNGYGTSGLPGGNAYLATRTENGWSNTALAPSGPDFDPGGRAFPAALSPDLRGTLWNMRRGDQPYNLVDLYVRGSDGAFTRIGGASDQPVASTIVASDDLSHVAYSTQAGETYEYVGGDDQRRAVSVDNAGQQLVPQCASTGVGTIQGSFYHAMSADGRVIFLTCSSANSSVYARVGGTTTIDVSGSQCTRGPSDPGGACDAGAEAIFQGANAGGTRAYFTTSQQLVNGDSDDTNDLYECDIPAGTPAPVGAVNSCPDLREVSGAVAGAHVLGVTRISDDGSRAYFVATGILASNSGANDASAVAGDDNLYVWSRDAAHPDGETRFVAKLDPADSVNLWNHDRDGRLAQATDDGRYLVFATYAKLIDQGSQADTDTARDIYRYDAETGALMRLTTDAYGEGGNEPGADATFIRVSHTPEVFSVVSSPRGAMSDDGSSVVFTTTEALAPNDTNDTVDVYLWHNGRVSLISSGKPSEDVNFGSFFSRDSVFGTNVTIQAVISPSGRDVYFTTTDPLVASDVDTTMDVYDARVDGGFDLSTLPACSGDACQSPPSAPPAAAMPGSTSSTGQSDSPQTMPAFSVGKLTSSQLKGVVSTGKVSLSVTTNAPGKLSAQATATIAKRSSTVGSAKRDVVKAGTVSLSLTLSKKARAELKSKRKLTVKVLVSQNNVAIARTVSLKLTQPKPAKKKTKNKSLRMTSRHAATRGGRS
ncbi:MAG TPA: hypothetical protein VIH85_24540 [Solirubrobacteraceae bacterium]